MANGQTQQSGFQYAVRAEIGRARAMHEDIHSLHEGYAVILEELDEVWREVKLRKPDKQRVLQELIQVAAMAWRTAVDCGLVES